MSNAKQLHLHRGLSRDTRDEFPRNTGLNVTSAMRIVLYMISEDRQFSCKWQTVVRLTEAGYISYIDGRTCITPLGRELLATPRHATLSQKRIAKSIKPGLKKAHPK